MRSLRGQNWHNLEREDDSSTGKFNRLKKMQMEQSQTMDKNTLGTDANFCLDMHFTFLSIGLFLTTPIMEENIIDMSHEGLF